MSIEETVAALQREEAAARQCHARHEAGLAQAEARVAAAREDLQAEFGVAVVGAARAALADLEGQLQAEAGEVRRLLALARGEVA